MNARKLLFSVELERDALEPTYLGLWAGADYHARSATDPKARGRVELRLMGLRSGGLHQMSIWPRKTMLADHAIRFSRDVKATDFTGLSWPQIAESIRSTVQNWYFGAHA